MRILDSFTRLERVDDAGGAASASTVIEKSASFGGGAAEIHSHTWNKPETYIWSCDRYYAAFALSPRPGPAWAAYLDTDKVVRESLGRMMFVPAGRTLQASRTEGKQRTLSCVFSSDLIGSILPLDHPWGEYYLAQGLKIGGPEVEWLTLRIYDEMRDERLGSNIVVESMFTALAVALIRNLRLDRIDASRSSGGLAPWRMRRIHDRVQSDLPPPDVSELAELCGMSVRHLMRAFKVETGQTVARYVQHETIRRARTLLADSRAPVNEIAQMLGFASSSAFSSAFRRTTGLRPSDIEGRRRLRGRKLDS